MTAMAQGKVMKFDDRLKEIFLNSCDRVQKKAYFIEVMKPSRPRQVTNVLEGATYNTKENDVILKGTVGELWVAPMEKVCKTYTKPDGSPLTPADFIPDRPLRVKTKPGNPCYAMHVSKSAMVEVKTAWGDVLLANRPGVEHGDGDFIVCGEKNGYPDLSDVWVVNGLVFKTTYEVLPKSTSKIAMEQEAGVRSKHYNPSNPNLSHKCELKNLQFNYRNLTMSFFDRAFLNNELRLTFTVCPTHDLRDPLDFVLVQVIKDGNIHYGLKTTQGSHVFEAIRRPLDQRYKTTRGIVEALYSVIRDGHFLYPHNPYAPLLYPVQVHGAYQSGVNAAGKRDFFEFRASFV